MVTKKGQGFASRPLIFTPVGLLCALLATASGCGGKSDNSKDIEEIGQQVGDVMASIDETGGSTGSLALIERGVKIFTRVEQKRVRKSLDGQKNLAEQKSLAEQKTLKADALHALRARDSELKFFERLERRQEHSGSSRLAQVTEELDRVLLPTASAATACSLASTFGTCTSSVITRTFADCTVGNATFNGTVTFTFNDAASNDTTCRLEATGHSITRVPAFTVKGRRGSTLTVSRSGSQGQVLTKDASPTFIFNSDGIRRVFTSSTGTDILDYTTQTTSPITINGLNRAGRTLTGGSVRVTNNLSSSSCDYVPSVVTWTANCNCPTSGSWSGSCSDGSNTTLTITGCGTAKLTHGADTDTFSFDRCYAI